jgi:hypothetical protein
MAIIGTYCHKGGLEATSAALLIALGLHLRGRQVDLMQISTQPLTQSFDADVELPFGYRPFAWEGSDSYGEVLETIDQARADGRDLVIDLPYVPILGWSGLFQRIAPVLIPLRPGSAYFDVACGSWQIVRDNLAASETPDASPWLLPFGWFDTARALWQTKGSLEARAASGDDCPPSAQLVPWNVPRLLPDITGALFDPDIISDTPQLRPVAATLAEIALRLAAEPGGTFGDGSGVSGVAEGDTPRHPSDPRDVPERLWELAEDLAIIKVGQGPSNAELDAAPVITDWHLAPEMGLVLVGRVEGHPDLGSRWIRTSQLYHFDELRSFARTLSRYYRLGRRSDEDEQ